MKIDVASASMPLPKVSDVCAACGVPIEDAVAIFSGVGRGQTFHVSCHEKAQPQTPEGGRD